MRLNLGRIERATRHLPREFRNSPEFECETLGAALGCRITLKVETLNPLRCFKGRGTQIAIAEAVERGFDRVVCASAGNLGQAVAYVCRRQNLECVIYASDQAQQAKLDRIADLGGNVRLVDGDIEVARKHAKRLVRDNPYYLIEDSENIATCEGAGTIGVELTADRSGTFDSLLVALGGGALATGVGCVFKNRSPTTKVVCVQPAGAPAMTLSWRKRSVVETTSTNTIADGVAGRCPIPEVLDDLLEVADDTILVQEATIVRGMKLLHEHAGLVTEPSAALGIAAILENKAAFQGQHIATILCGSNVNRNDFNRWVFEQ